MSKRKQTQAQSKKANCNAVLAAVHRKQQNVGYIEAQQTPKKANFTAYAPPTGVVPENHKDNTPKFANDSAYTGFDNYIESISGYNTVIFRGYGHYAQLANMPEFRKILDVISTEMTRKWIKLKSTSKNVSDKILQIEEEMNRLGVKERIAELISMELTHGRGQLFINLKMPSGSGETSDNDDELKIPLALDRAKIPENGIVELVPVDPIWTSAAEYESLNPLKSDYLKPRSWFVNGKQVHSSRLITLIMRPVASFLKPAFNFGGLSFLQQVEPTVNNWLEVRDSGKELVKGGNILVLKTNASAITGGASYDYNNSQDVDNLLSRIQLFMQTRNNKGVMLVDKTDEELENVNVSMSGIPEMITKYQEQTSQVTGIPVVKLTGNTPSGLNASSDGEIRVFYDTIHAMNESFLREPIKYIIDLIQVSLFGKVDHSIAFDFLPLYQLNEKEQAEVNEIKSRELQTYVDSGAITDEDLRNILINSERPEFSDLTPEKLDDDDDDEQETEAIDSQSSANK